MNALKIFLLHNFFLYALFEVVRNTWAEIMLPFVLHSYRFPNITNISTEVRIMRPRRKKYSYFGPKPVMFLKLYIRNKLFSKICKCAVL